jgi:hypothetical protein
MNISANFLPDRKVLWMTFEQLFQSFVKLSIFDGSRAICSRGKINFWSIWVRKGPDFFHRNPSRGCIDSIKSAGERSQKVGLILCQGIFLKHVFRVEFLFRKMPFIPQPRGIFRFESQRTPAHAAHQSAAIAAIEFDSDLP